MEHTQNTQCLDEATCFAAVMARDHRFNGQFVFAVITTKIYCRPDCSARRPKRTNIRFFVNNTAAEQAGFRACLRCNPKDEDRYAQHRDNVVAVCRLIEQAQTPPSLQVMADHVGLSPYYFHRIFKRETGLTPKQYILVQQDQALRRELLTQRRITDAIYEVGFNSSSQFYQKTYERLGMQAKAYRSGGKNNRIYFAIATSDLGEVLVAQTHKGVCAILMGDHPELLLNELQDLFPKAALIGADADFEHTVAKVIGFIATPQQPLVLPLDIEGTIFQRKVWALLQTIPLGATLSYQEIAERLGNKKAVRAVANACAANKLALAVPCHRVIRTDGRLSGYRWGIERKTALLQREQDHADDASS